MSQLGYFAYCLGWRQELYQVRAEERGRDFAQRAGMPMSAQSVDLNFRVSKRIPKRTRRSSRVMATAGRFRKTAVRRHAAAPMALELSRCRRSRRPQPWAEPSLRSVWTSPSHSRTSRQRRGGNGGTCRGVSRVRRLRRKVQPSVLPTQSLGRRQSGPGPGDRLGLSECRVRAKEVVFGWDRPE